MANYRQIHVSIWKDGWFLDLDPREKLLFIYLFSNANTNLAGIYKISLRVVAFETCLGMAYVLEAMEKFRKAGKVYYEDGIVWVTNMRRYHESKSPLVQQRIAADIAAIPDCQLKIDYTYTIHSRSYKDKEEDKDKDKDKEIEKDETPETEETSVQRLAEKLIGLPAMPGDVEVLNAWERDGVTEADIRDALQWRVDQGRPPVKTISQLAGGVAVSHSRRVQGASAKGNGKGAARAISTPESFKESEYAGWYVADEDEPAARAT